MKKKIIIILSSIILVVIVLIACFFIFFQNSDELTYIAKSNSMNPGISLGDELIYKKIQDKSEIITYVLGNASDYKKFGDYGDVIIYHPYGDNNCEKILHRAICWIQYHDEYSTYSVGEYDQNNVTSITISELGLDEYKPDHSGYITKGDNNPSCDQLHTSLCSEPIKVEWIFGKVISHKLLALEKN